VISNFKTVGEGDIHRCRVKGVEKGVANMDLEIKLSSEVSTHLTPSACSRRRWQTVIQNTTDLGTTTGVAF